MNKYENIPCFSPIVIERWKKRSFGRESEYSRNSIITSIKSTTPIIYMLDDVPSRKGQSRSSRWPWLCQLPSTPKVIGYFIIQKSKEGVYDRNLQFRVSDILMGNFVRKSYWIHFIFYYLFVYWEDCFQSLFLRLTMCNAS